MKFIDAVRKQTGIAQMEAISALVMLIETLAWSMHAAGADINIYKRQLRLVQGMFPDSKEFDIPRALFQQVLEDLEAQSKETPSHVIKGGVTD